MIEFSSLGLSTEQSQNLAAKLQSDLLSGHMPELESSAIDGLVANLQACSFAHEFEAIILDPHGRRVGEVRGLLDGSRLHYSVASEASQETPSK